MTDPFNSRSYTESGSSGKRNIETNLNFESRNPFDDIVEGESNALELQNIHLYLRQRTGRKGITVVQGLSDQLDWKRLSKAFQKKFACSASIEEDVQLGPVIQLQGDLRAKIREFLLKEELAKSDQIKIHGT